MDFQVLPPRTSPNYDSTALFALIQHTWNDYSFETQYSLVYLGPEEQRSHNLIGTVKILKRGQRAVDGLQIVNDFDVLGEDYISVGQSLDYYQRLSALEDTLRKKLLIALKDFIYSPGRAESFRLEDGWNTSLFRYFGENDAFLQTARSLLVKNFDSLLAQDLKFSFAVPGWQKIVTFDYSLPEYAEIVGNRKAPLPNRIFSVIGRNGSGKSTLLARIARVAYGSLKDRHDESLSSLGKILPDEVSFPRIITVSYSAFDSFRLPALRPTAEGEADERVQVVKDIRMGVGRFVFCGLRDVAAELEADIEGEGFFGPFAAHSDKLGKTLLKSIEQLAREFEETLQLVQETEAQALLDQSLAYLSTDSSFSTDSKNLNSDFLLRNGPREIFLQWSTGHKIVMHIICKLAAHTTQSSLILIDEPETHLHPPLLAALMHAIRNILNVRKAFAIVATHSPVVLQETIAKHTLVIRREDNITVTKSPSKETFGENVGTLTGDIFGLSTRETDYHKVLNDLIEKHQNLDVIEYFFQPHGLSMQARAYVIAELAKRGLI